MRCTKSSNVSPRRKLARFGFVRNVDIKFKRFSDGRVNLRMNNDIIDLASYMRVFREGNKLSLELVLFQLISGTMNERVFDENGTMRSLREENNFATLWLTQVIYLSSICRFEILSKILNRLDLEDNLKFDWWVAVFSQWWQITKRELNYSNS